MNVNELVKPLMLDEAIQVAEKLAKPFPFVRVDLYLINHKIYFGELTFFHDGGAVALEPEEWENTFGGWINLPKITND